MEWESSLLEISAGEYLAGRGVCLHISPYNGSHQTKPSSWSHPAVPHLIPDLICDCWASWATQRQPNHASFPSNIVFPTAAGRGIQCPVCKIQPLGAVWALNWSDRGLCSVSPSSMAVDLLHMLKLAPFILKTWCPWTNCLVETIPGSWDLLSSAWVSFGQCYLAWAKTMQKAALAVKATDYSGPLPVPLPWPWFIYLYWCSLRDAQLIKPLLCPVH